jgi:hypothetical protein
MAPAFVLSGSRNVTSQRPHARGARGRALSRSVHVPGWRNAERVQHIQRELAVGCRNRATRQSGTRRRRRRRAQLALVTPAASDDAGPPAHAVGLIARRTCSLLGVAAP